MLFKIKINKRQASLFVCVLVASLAILKHGLLSAETPKSLLSDSSTTMIKKNETEPQNPNLNVEERKCEQFESLEQAMMCPQTIPIPKGLPTYKMSGDAIEFTRHDFEHHYLDGWNECLYVIANSKNEFQDIEMTSTGTSFRNRELLSAQLVKGFFDCKNRCLELAKINDVSSIRRVSKALHREMENNAGWIRR